MDDLNKILPTAIVFCFPGMGYVVPVIAFMFPKKLLSHHFWTAKQKKKFRMEDHSRRSKHYGALLEHLNLTEHLLPLLVHLDEGEHPINADLLQFQALFSSTGGQLSLYDIP